MFDILHITTAHCNAPSADRSIEQLSLQGRRSTSEGTHKLHIDKRNLKRKVSDSLENTDIVDQGKRQRKYPVPEIVDEDVEQLTNEILKEIVKKEIKQKVDKLLKHIVQEVVKQKREEEAKQMIEEILKQRVEEEIKTAEEAFTWTLQEFVKQTVEKEVKRLADELIKQSIEK